MARARLSQLQRRILLWVDAEEQRTRRTVSPSYEELIQALRVVGVDKGNASKSVRNLEEKALVMVGRTAGGMAEFLRLTSEGRNVVSNLVGSCD